MSIQSCYFCVQKVVILNVFKIGINVVSFLPVFLSCVLGVFNSPVATPTHGLLGLNPSLRLQVIWENASLLCKMYAATHGPTSLSC